MSYLTRHRLSIEPENDDIFEYIEDNEEALLSIIGFNKAWGKSTTWYDHEKDLRRISLLFPNSLLKLEGRGEIDDDMWLEYYKDGKMQRCNAIITFDKFNEEMLE